MTIDPSKLPEAECGQGCGAAEAEWIYATGGDLEWSPVMSRLLGILLLAAACDQQAEVPAEPSAVHAERIAAVESYDRQIFQWEPQESAPEIDRHVQ